MVLLRLFILFLFAFNVNYAEAQLYKLSSLDTARVYTSLEEAQKRPLDVIRLDLKGKKWKQFPTTIFEFKNIQELNLKKNKIKEIPPEIEQLKKLQILDLSKNLIEILPPEIGQLNNLKVLKLGQNELINLPWEIGQLEKLLFLDLWSNNLTDLPGSIQKLKNLKTIDLRVIQFNDKKQQEIQALIPQVKILFSNSCNCD